VIANCRSTAPNDRAAKRACLLTALALTLLSFGCYYAYGACLRMSSGLIVQQRPGFQVWGNLAGLSHLLAILLASCACASAVVCVRKRGGGRIMDVAALLALVLATLETLAWIVLIA
jgi:hypothetical protein